MNSWMDAVDKLRSLGYSVTLNEGKLKYIYLGKDNPSQDEITPLLEVLKAHKGNILNDPYFLIEQTLQEVNRGYHPGTIEWMKQNRLEELEGIKALEGKINKSAISGNMETLRKNLDDYQSVVLDMVKFLRFLGGRTGN